MAARLTADGTRWVNKRTRPRGLVKRAWLELKCKDDLRELKEMLKAKGWTYRSAAKALGTGYQYLCDILNGRRQSKRMVERIRDLPNQREVFTDGAGI